MPVRVRLALSLILVMATLLGGCSPRGLLKQFEYEEEIYLALDGSADVVVNASIPALVALRGLPLRADASSRLDRNVVRRLFEGPGVNVTRVSRPWRRRGRRFIQVRLTVDDIRRLSTVAPFGWSEYRLDRHGREVDFRQTVAKPTGPAVSSDTWRGDELIGFRMHVPSRILYHNAPSKTVERGNILSWEQALSERLSGTPIVMEVRMEAQSILRRTLTVFGTAAATALLLFAAAVYWVWRKGRVTSRGTGAS